MSAMALILASGSTSRRAMLEAAGVTFIVSVPDLDEGVLKQSLLGSCKDATALAQALADAKTLSVVQRHPDALVLGADQVLVCQDRIFNKAMDRDAARQTLEILRGKNHTLISAAAIAKDGQIVRRCHDSATLHMRDFSDAFLDAYLTAEIPDVLGSVGCYRVEGRGAQLFDEVQGDQFCIRGLPLFPVLNALRQFGALLE